MISGFKQQLSKKRTWLILVLILIVGGFVFFSSQKNADSDRSLKLEQSNLIQKVTIAGSVVPSRRAIILPPYNGYVRKLFVKVGDMVKLGDALVTVSQSLSGGETSYPLRAPMGGAVVQVNRLEGEMVREHDPKEFILKIDDLSKICIDATTPEADRVRLKVGQEGIVQIGAIQNKKYKAKIVELALAANEAEGRNSSSSEFKVRLEVLDPDDQIKSGMSALVDVITAQRENVITVRHEYLSKAEDGFEVLLKSGEYRSVKVGLQNEEAFEITDGLKIGDVIMPADLSAEGDDEVSGKGRRGRGRGRRR